MGPKYEFTDETMNYDGHTLYRIRRIEDGRLGGWIESEYNLSQDGKCFVYDTAQVYGNVEVCGEAQVYGNACVFDNAYVYDTAKVYGDAAVFDNVYVLYQQLKESYISLTCDEEVTT